MTRAEQARALAASALTLFACTVDELDLEGRQCPCVAGWMCDETSGMCVPMEGMDMDGGVTPGRDGGRPPDRTVPPGVDGGPRTDAPTPPGEDGGPPPDPTTHCTVRFADRLFCDGFEDGTTDAWDGVETSDVDVSIVGDPVYMGDRALRVHGMVGSGYGGVWATVYPDTSVDQWLRGYYYFPSSNGFGVEVNSMAEYDFTYDLVVSIDWGEVDFHTHSVDPTVQDSDTFAPAADTWVCIELHVRFGATTGLVEVFFDDALVLESRDVVFEPPRGLGNITAGFAWKDSDSDNVVYVDEVVADNARIGCD